MVSRLFNKKKVRHYLGVGLVTWLIAGSFLFSQKAEALTDPMIYQKAVNGTLSATEWNNLLNDFVAYRDGGKVGIGTTNPVSTLNVSRTTSGTSATLTVKPSGTGANVYQDLDFEHWNWDASPRTLAKIRSTMRGFGEGELSLWTALGSTAYERLTITKDGNVGIGTSNPNDIFSIGNGGSAAPAGSSGTGHNFTQTYINSDKYALANYGLVETLVANATSSLAQAIGFWNANGANIYNINTGNVGVGTTNPGSKLSINDTLTTGQSYLTITNNSNELLSFRHWATSFIEIYSPRSLYFKSGSTGTNQVVFKSGSFQIENPIAVFRGYGGTLEFKTTGGSSHDIFFSPNSVEAMRLTSSGLVGIGTTAPNDALSIGNAGSSAPAGSSNTGHNFTQTYLNSDKYALANYGLVETLVANATSSLASAIGFWNASGTNIYNINTGNVGIGTTNPGAKLEVSGNMLVGTSTSNSLQKIKLISSGSASGDYSGISFSGWNNVAKAAVGIRRTGTYGVGDLAFFLNSTVDANDVTIADEKMRITSGGNVGIGTNNPIAMLDITKLLTQGTTQDMLSFKHDGSWGLRLVQNFSASGNMQYDWIQKESGVDKNVMSFQHGNVGIGTTNPNDTLSISDSAGNSSPAGAARTGHNYTSTYISADKYALANYGLVESMVNNSSFWSLNGTHIYNNNSGNVGIGLNNPNSRLTIVSSGSAQQAIIPNAANSVTIFGNGSAFFTGRDTANNIEFAMGTSNLGEAFAGAMTAHDMSLRTNNINRVTVKSSTGDVGIGTTAPGAKLELVVPQVTSAIASTTDLGSSAIIINGKGAVNNTKVGLMGSFGAGGDISSGLVLGRQGTSWGTYIAFHTHPNNSKNLKDFTERMRIDMNGNIGIGTEIPNDTLSIGNAGSAAPAGSAGTGHNFTQTYLSSDNYALVNYGLLKTMLESPTGQVGYWTLSGTNIYNNNTGNIAVGTTTPSAKFTINNTAAFSVSSLSTARDARNAFRIRGRDTATSTLMIGSVGINDYAIQNVDDAGTGANNIFINPFGGNVAVGRINPNVKLDVAGSIARGTRLRPDLKQVVGVDTDGQNLMIIDPSWSNEDLQAYFACNNVDWYNDPTAPGGYAIRISNSSCYVAPNYGSGVPLIPVDDDDVFYVEAWVKHNDPTARRFYFGSYGYNSALGGLGNNYWTNPIVPTDTWTKISAYKAASTLPAGTKYISPLALLFYSGGAGYEGYVSGWKVIKVNSEGNRYFADKVGIGSTTTPSDIFSIANGGAYAPNGSANTGHNFTQTYLSADKYALANYGLVETLVANATSSLASAIGFWNANGANIYNINTGNVGIGTTNPSNKLELSLTSASTNLDLTTNYALRISNNSWAGSMISGIEFWNGASKTVATSRIISQMNGSGSGGENLHFQTQSPSATNPNPNQPTTKLSIRANGNVGIGGGESQPNDILSITNTGAYAPTGSSGTGHNYTQTYLSTDKYALANYGLVETLINTMVPPIISPIIASSSLWGANGNHIFNTNTGNVGIGKTNPTSKLDVAGDIYTSGFMRTQGVRIGNIRSEKVMTVSFPNGVSQQAVDIILPAGTYFWGSIQFNITGTYGHINGTGRYTPRWSGGMNPNGALYDSQWEVESDQGLTADRVQLSGPFWDSTNSRWYFTLKHRVSNGNAYYIHAVGITAGAAALPGFENITVGPVYVYSGDIPNRDNWNLNNGAVIYNKLGNNLLLTGSVGIGTTTPSSKLHLIGDIEIGQSSTSGGTLKFNSAGTSIPGLLTYSPVGFNMSATAGDNRNLTIVNGAFGSGNTMGLLVEGNVGIGTSNPNDIFSIGNAGSSAPAGSSNTGHNFTQTYINSDKYALANYGLVETLINTMVPPIISPIIASSSLWGANGNHIFNTNTGNVGIGITSPRGQLHLSSTTPSILIEDSDASSVGKLQIAINNDITTFNSLNNSYNLHRSIVSMNLNTGDFSLPGTTLFNLSNSGAKTVYASRWRVGDNINNFVIQDTQSSHNVLEIEKNGTAASLYIKSNGFVGIGTTAPNDALSIGNAGSSAPAGSSNTGHNFTQTYLNSDKYALANYGLVETLVANATSSLASAIGFWNASGANIYNINAGNVGIGTTAPGSMLDVNGLIKMRTSTITYPEDVVNKGYVDSAIGTATSTISGAYLPLAGGTMNASAAINMNSGSITNLNQLTVSKITANTIDPLYRIKGINYSTFAAAIVGGVKEEYVGQAKISQRNTSGEYEYVVDFAKEQEGSDLWVWHKTVDYKDDKVQVFITPTRSFAQTYYIVEGDRLILRADKPVSVSYRLIGNRFDWRSWPTLSDDQESTGLIVP